MKEYLLKLIKNWSQSDADKFHSHCDRDDIEGRYIWHYDDNGITIYRDITAVNISNTGKVCKLTKEWKDYEWKAFTQLYNLSVDTKEFRVETPIEHSVIDTGLFYSEVQRPQHEIGLDFQYDILENNINKEYYLDYIDQTVILFRYLKRVVNSINGCGYPEVGIPPTKRLRDSKGYFWSDFKKWNLSEQDFKNRIKNDLNVSLFYIENNIGPIEYKHDVISYAEEEWKTI